MPRFLIGTTLPHSINSWLFQYQQRVNCILTTASRNVIALLNFGFTSGCAQYSLKRALPMGCSSHILSKFLSVKDKKKKKNKFKMLYYYKCTHLKI